MNGNEDDCDPRFEDCEEAPPPLPDLRGLFPDLTITERDITALDAFEEARDRFCAQNPGADGCPPILTALPLPAPVPVPTPAPIPPAPSPFPGPNVPPANDPIFRQPPTGVFGRVLGGAVVITAEIMRRIILGQQQDRIDFELARLEEMLRNEALRRRREEELQDLIDRISASIPDELPIPERPPPVEIPDLPPNAVPDPLALPDFDPTPIGLPEIVLPRPLPDIRPPTVPQPAPVPRPATEPFPRIGTPPGLPGGLPGPLTFPFPSFPGVPSSPFPLPGAPPLPFSPPIGVPAPAPLPLPTPSPTPLTPINPGGVPLPGFGFNPFAGFDALPEPVAQPQTQECQVVNRRRRRKGKCREGFFRESPGSTRFITWRTRKC